MKAIVKEKKGIDNITYKEVPTPEIDDDEVLIKVKAAGVCSTDLRIFYDEFPYWPPVILGHEFSGIIEKTGKNISRFKNGDRVTSEPQQKVCGVCRYCRSGLSHLCSSKRSPGWGIDGAMAEYIKLPDKLLHKLPEDVSFVEGALIEPASTVAHAIIERGNIIPTDYVVVIGPGPIGLIAVQIARGSGAQTVVVSGLNKDMEYRSSVARELCVDKIINAEKEDLDYFVRENTGGFGADMAIECSGSENGINQAIDILAKNGKLIGVGLSGKKSLNLKWDKAILNELNIIPSMSSTYCSWKYALDMLKTKKLNLSKIISNILPMSRYREAFELTRNRQRLKIVLVPDADFSNYLAVNSSFI